MRKSNLTYEEVIELAPKDKCFYIEVESNPEGKGGRQKLLAFLTEDGKSFNTYFTEPNQVNINGIEYFGDWKNNYKGTFELIGYVRPVEKVEEKIDFEEMKGIPGFDGMIEEFEELCIKAQDIINKYKK